MEAPHVVTLRKNLVYLKEHLEVKEALDHLYQEGVFTQPEYNRCKQAGPDKCGTLLELLMKKGEEAYKSLCVHLDSSHPHVKNQLDLTSTAEGATNLLFVNKLKIEREHKQAILEKDQINADLQDETKNLKMELASKEEAMVGIKATKEEEEQKHAEEFEEERRKYKARLDERRQKLEKLERQNKEHEEEIQNLKKEIDQLKTALSFEKEKYEAVTELTLNQEPDDDEQEQRANVEGTGNMDQVKVCVFGPQPTCDESQLMLLPCLHAACKPLY